MADVPGMSDIPPEVLRVLSGDPVDLPTDPNKPVVDVEQLNKDLDYRVGDKTGFDKVKTEARQDPVEALTRPTDAYDRKFFFPGLVHGFCLIPQTLTERYRSATEAPLDSWVHRTNHPLVSIPFVKGFEKSQLAYSLQSVGLKNADAFFQFLGEQVLVRRDQKVVWKIDVVDVRVLDPFLVDDKDKPPYEVLIKVLCPRTYKGAYKVRPPKNPMLIGTPEIEFVSLHNTELEALTKEILGG